MNFNLSEEFLPLENGMRTKNFKLACTYIHGIFGNDNFRNEWLNNIRKQKNCAARKVVSTRNAINDSFDAIAQALRDNLDINFLLQYITM